MSRSRSNLDRTRNDYRERVLRVLRHIQEHLDEALDTEELARIACFSSFHFHRIFAAMTGETIADHVRRLRLERAAMQLRSSPKQVIQVALDAGYQAHEAFTRAFKAAFGISPAAFRRVAEPHPFLPAPSGVHFQPGVRVTAFNVGHIAIKFMKVVTRTTKPWRVAYLRHLGPYENLGNVSFDLMTRLSADKQIRKHSTFIGIGRDNPAVTPASALRFDACFTVDQKYAPEKPIELQTIPGGDYAVAKNCPYGKIKDAYKYLYGKWLPRSSRELRSLPSFILMANVGDAVARNKGRYDIYLPLQPRRRTSRPAPIQIDVTTWEPQRVAYLRHVGPYQEANRTWLEFMTRLQKDGLPREGALLIGVPLDNPKTTPPEKRRYDVCVTVDDTYAPKAPLQVRMIEGGDYAVARNCPFASIAKAYAELYGSWLLSSGRKLRKAPSHLVRVNGPDGRPPAVWLTDIYVPLAPAKKPPLPPHVVST